MSFNLTNWEGLGTKLNNSLLLFSELHDKDGRARYFSLDLVKKRGKLVRVTSLPDSLAPSTLRGFDHHRVTYTLSHLELEQKR